MQFDTIAFRQKRGKAHSSILTWKRSGQQNIQFKKLYVRFLYFSLIFPFHVD